MNAQKTILSPNVIVREGGVPIGYIESMSFSVITDRPTVELNMVTSTGLYLTAVIEKISMEGSSVVFDVLTIGSNPSISEAGTRLDAIVDDFNRAYGAWSKRFNAGANLGVKYEENGKKLSVLDVGFYNATKPNTEIVDKYSKLLEDVYERHSDGTRVEPEPRHDRKAVVDETRYPDGSSRES